MGLLSARLTPLTVSVPAASEWVSFTPSWNNVTLGTGPINTGRWRRTGDSVEVQFYLALGTGGAFTGTAGLTLPASLTADTAKLAENNGVSMGTARLYDASATTAYVALSRYTSARTQIEFLGQSTNPGEVNATAPFTWAVSDILSGSCTVPITGWTSHTASATSANAVVVGGQSVGSKLNLGATSAQGVALLANNAAILDSNSTGLIGLKFAPTASVSADVNTLDDYEEGTWTPVLDFAIPGTAATYGANRYGHYQKIGNRVYFHCYVVLATKGTGTGTVLITGLPFTPVAVSSGGISCCSVWTSGISRTNHQITAYVDAPLARIQFGGTPINADAGAAVNIDNTHVSGTASLMVTGFYITAS